MKAVEFVRCSIGYSGRPVIEDFTAHVEEGEILNVYGENGSGKTTLLRALIGAAVVRGSIRIFSRNILDLLPAEKVRYVSVLFGEVIRSDITSERYLSLSFMSDWRDLAEFFGISDLLHIPMRRLSSGQNRKVQLVRALSSTAPVLALDEPFAHLDEESKERVLQKVLDLRRKGRTIIITSHKPLGLGKAVRLTEFNPHFRS